MKSLQARSWTADVPAWLFVLATTLWVLIVGKDLSWDVINHHLYLPFSLFSGRFATDLFGAGPQSYQNPLGYTPFYLLLQTGMPGWALGTAIGLLHGLMGFPLWRVACRLWPDAAADPWWRLLGLAMCWVAPIFLLMAGTSSADPWATLLVLWAAAWLIGRGPDSPLPMAGAAAAGLALGLAFAIKPSNAIFAIALGCVVLVRIASRQAGWRHLAVLVLAVAAATAVAMGPWSLWLWKTFDNPIFPLFNHLFHSPFAPQAPLSTYRFVMQGPLDLLTRPFQLAEYRAYVSTEGFAPDVRLAALALLALPAAWMAVRRVGSRTGRQVESEPSWLQRPDMQLLVFVAISYVLWMLTSGNARYAIPLFMIVGLLVVRAAQAALPASLARVLLLILLILQFLYFAKDGTIRYLGKPWGVGPFLDVRVPERLRETPFLHLNIGSPSYAGLAPFLNADGALMNIVGNMSLPVTGALGKAVQGRLSQWQGRTRFLLAGKPHEPNQMSSPQFRARANELVYRFGLEFDWSDCEVIRVFRDPPRVLAAPDSPSPGTPFMSCGAKPRQHDDPTYPARLEQAIRAFAVLEAQCPAALAPTPLATDGSGDVWYRNYGDSDIRATVSSADGVALSHFRSRSPVAIGTMAAVIAGKGIPACQAVAALTLE